MNNKRAILIIVLIAVVAVVAAFYYMNGNTVSTQTQGAAVANSDSPNINLTSNPAVVVKGGKASLVWSTVGFNTCSIRGATLVANALVAVQGSQSTGALTASSAYTLSCQHKNGTVESKTINVIVR